MKKLSEEVNEDSSPNVSLNINDDVQRFSPQAHDDTAFNLKNLTFKLMELKKNMSNKKHKTKNNSPSHYNESSRNLKNIDSNKVFLYFLLFQFHVFL